MGSVHLQVVNQILILLNQDLEIVLDVLLVLLQESLAGLAWGLLAAQVVD